MHMCGILGVVGLNEHAHLDPLLTIRMNKSMEHRGPDGDGFLFAGKFDQAQFQHALSSPKTLHFYQPKKHPMIWGQRRLAIIDLDIRAGQPMNDVHNKAWVNFNGEIYNHAELRQELEQLGYAFKTHHSDTEVIINAYLHWGKNFIHKLRGMFAIALWDVQKDLIYLYRDRIGIKPLYYTIHNHKLYFASEIKAILEDPSIPRSMNLRGMYDYLSFLTVPAPETLFDGIYKLPAGHFMTIQGDSISTPEPYWDVFDHVVMDNSSEEEIKTKILWKLEEAVKYRMVSDVPVGVFLSGGIDSSTNAALFQKIAKHPVKAFSIGYKNDSTLTTYKNEFVYARQVARELGCEYYELELTEEDLVEFLPKMVHFQDEPIGDPVCMPVYYVSKLAREHGVTVAQVGEGSDEIFWGYQSWKRNLRLEKMNHWPVPDLFKKIALFGLSATGQSHGLPYEYLSRGVLHKPLFWGGVEAFGEKEKHGLLTGDAREVNKNYSAWDAIEPHYRKYLKVAPEKHPINWMAYLDLKIRLPELLLMRVDKMSMAVSLEGRVPFLDHEFVTYAMSIPAALKTKHNENKYILKKAVEGLIPHNIINRPKQGFGVPVYDWFLRDFGPMAQKELLSFCKKTDLIDSSSLQNLFKHPSKSSGVKIWYLLNLALWYKQYIEK